MKRIVSLLLVLCCATLQAQDINKTLARMPENANVLTVVNTRGLMNSQKARTEGWAQSLNLDYLSGKMAFPPSVTFIVVAADYNASERRNDWQVGLFEFPGQVQQDQVAARVGSNVEIVENLAVIPSRRNIYFVRFDRENFATFMPANRNKLVNWIKHARTNTTNKVNNYLTDAVVRGGADGQVNIAMDLTNALDRVEITTRLQASKAVTDAGVDRLKLTNLIASIRGFRLSINVTNVNQVQFFVDFGEDIGEFANVLPALLLETLTRNDFNMGDASQWQTNSRGKTFSARGAIDDDEFKRILAIVLPRTMDSSITNLLGTGQTGEAAIATTSQAYFRAVRRLLDDLRVRSDRLDRQRAWNTNASWYEYAAQKIDALPVVNTDEALLAYSAEVAAQLRLMGESLRGVTISGRVIDTYRRGGTDLGWGGFNNGWGGGWGVVSGSNVQQVESSKAEVAAAGAKDRNAIWVRIGEQTNAIRSEMARKHRIEF